MDMPPVRRARGASRLRVETGQVLVLVTLMLPMFLGMAALVIDVGHLFVEKRTLQQAADAAALAAAQELTGGSCDAICTSAVTSVAADYSTANGARTTIGALPACGADVTANCFRIVDDDKVEVKLEERVNTFFGGILGASNFVVRARAVAASYPYTTTTPGATVTEPGSTVVNTTTTGGSQSAIFIRARICSSFFFPGSDNVVTGLSTYGGVGSMGSNNTVQAILMNNYFYNKNGCSYPTSGAPQPPSFWCYSDPGHVPCDGIGPSSWLVPFPDLGTVARDNATHCLYTSTTLTGKALTGGTATVTTSRPTCLHTGDKVTVDLVDNRFDCASCTVTAADTNHFSYAKSLATFARSASTKALQSGVATLTTTAAHGLTPGDIVTVTGVDSTFNGTYTVSAVPSTTTFSYARTIPNVDVSVSTKAMTAGVATLTTSSAHHLAAGDSVTVSIGDPRFDGTFTVASVPSSTSFTYPPAAVTSAVTNGAVSAGVATLTTSSPHGLVAGNSVVVNLGDPRFDGTFTVTAPVTGTTLSYASPSVAITAWSISSNTATMTATTPPHGLAVGNVVTITGFSGGGAPTYFNNGTYTVSAVNAAAGTFSFGFTHANASGTQNANAKITTVASAAASGTVKPWTLASTAASGTVSVPGFVSSTAVSPVGTVTFTGAVAPTTISGTNTATSGTLAQTWTNWTSTHPPGIYMVDAPNGTSLTISATNTDFHGYSWVAPEILISGGGNTFANYASAPGELVFMAYDPNGDAVHESAVSYITGSIFCGPPEPPAGATSDPTNKCWFGGNGSTFKGLLEAWKIEWKLDDSVFDGTGPLIGGTTSTTTTVTPGKTTTTPDVVVTVGTGSNLSE
jgi:Flp pilus assembly protein TadG